MFTPATLARPQRPHYRPARTRSAPGPGPGPRRARRRTWAALRPTSRPSPLGEALAGARPFPSNRTASSARPPASPQRGPLLSSARPHPLSEALSSARPRPLSKALSSSRPDFPERESGPPPARVPSEGPSPARVRPSPASPRRARPPLARVLSPPAGRSRASAGCASSYGTPAPPPAITPPRPRRDVVAVRVSSSRVGLRFLPEMSRGTWKTLSSFDDPQ